MAKIKQSVIINTKYGRWTVLEKTDKRFHANILWRCRCDCGTERLLIGHTIKSGHSKSCGCLAKSNTKPQHELQSFKRWKGKYRQATTPEYYLEQRLVKTDSCWIWTAAKDRDGYGQCHASRVAKDLGVTRAHQMAFVTWVGPNPNKLLVCHKCDNPSCCNPLHLFLGTNNDNVQDMMQKGRNVIPDKRNKHTNEIIAAFGKENCFEVAKKFNLSFSTICRIWRNNGFKSRPSHKR